MMQHVERKSSTLFGRQHARKPAFGVYQAFHGHNGCCLQSLNLSRRPLRPCVGYTRMVMCFDQGEHKVRPYGTSARRLQNSNMVSASARLSASLTITVSAISTSMPMSRI